MTPAQKAKLARIAAACQLDPLRWVEAAYPWGVPGTKFEGQDIRYWQAEILGAISDHLQDPKTRYDVCHVAVASGHGIGKSALIGMVSNWAMSCWPGARVVATANTENQLRTKTSPEVGQWFRDSISAEMFNIDTMSIKAREAGAEAWVMDFVPWSETNTEAFAGLHAAGRLVALIMDEGSAISDKVWEVAEGALTDENTILIWIVMGNPTRSTGRFRECFRRFRHVWKTWHIDSRTVEGTNKKRLQQIVDTYGEDSDVAKIRVRGMFPSASSRQLIPAHVVDEAYGRHLTANQYEFAPVIIGVDPAWTGEDDFVIVKRQGLKVDILDIIPKNDNDVFMASKIANYEARYNAAAVFIDYGLGTGIKSVGDTMGRAWQLVNFSEKAPEAGFINMRAYIWSKMGDWLREGGAIPPNPELYEDLIGVELKPTPNGAIQLVSKEDMRKMGLRSPNIGDAIALTFARPVFNDPADMMQGRPRASREKQGYSKEYDPLA